MDEEVVAVEVRLSRDLTLLRATLMGIGATVGAGIFVLLGFALGAAGPSVVLAIALNGLVAGLTAVTYADLGTTFPEAGGGYLWAREALPNPLAFAAGWMTWFGHLIAGAVGALGFGYYVSWGLQLQGWLSPSSGREAAIGVALLITGVYVAIGYLGLQARRRGFGLAGFVKLAILLTLLAFGLVVIGRGAANPLEPFLAYGSFGVLSAMALTFVAFQGFEGIAQAGEEIRDPERTIPRAIFVSLAVVLGLYLALAGVALSATSTPASITVWEYLRDQEALAIVEVGRQVIPSIGAPLLAVGGLVATLTALSTTLFSASRVSFAMGRDRVLPQSIGRVHPRFRAPSTAILTSGLVMLSLILFSDLQVVATTAGLAFLVAFVLVNVALIRWRVAHPEVRRGFTAPLFPVLPALAIAANLVLITWLAVQPGAGRTAWSVIILWIGIGFLLYYPFRGRSEIAKPLPKRIDVAQLLAAEAPPVVLEKYRVLLPLQEFTNLPLVRLAGLLASARRGELSLLNILEIPRTLPPKAIRFHYVDERIKALHRVEKTVRDIAPDTRSVVRIGHLPPEIVLRTLEEEDVNLLVLGWRGGHDDQGTGILDDTIDYLVQRAPCDVVVARTKGLKEEIGSLLLYARSEEHTQGVVELAAILASTRVVRITVLDVSEEAKGGGPNAERIAANLRRMGLTCEVKRVAAKSAAEAVVTESANHDLLLLGAGERGALRRGTFGPTVDDIAARAPCPVLVYRRGERVASGG